MRDVRAYMTRVMCMHSRARMWRRNGNVCIIITVFFLKLKTLVNKYYILQRMNEKIIILRIEAIWHSIMALRQVSLTVHDNQSRAIYFIFRPHNRPEWLVKYRQNMLYVVNHWWWKKKENNYIVWKLIISVA